MAIAAPLRGFATRPVIALCAATMLLPAILSFWEATDICEIEKSATIFDVAEERCAEPDPMFLAYGPNVETTLVQQQAEQNTTAVAQNVQQLLWPNYGEYWPSTDPYGDLAAFTGDDIVSNLISNIGQLLLRWWSQSVYQIALIGITTIFGSVALRQFKSRSGKVI